MTDQNHARFLRALDDSLPGVLRVAEWLVRRGRNVRISGQHRAPTHEQWQDYSDSGDLMIEQRIEVKHRTFDFTSADDWPYADVAVCAQHSWQRAEQKPLAFVSVSCDMTHVAIVLASSAKHWSVRPCTDSRYDGVTQDTFFCPLSSVTFLRLPKIKKAPVTQQ